MWWVLISIAAVPVIAWLTYDGGSLDYRQREADAAAGDTAAAAAMKRRTPEAVVGDPVPSGRRSGCTASSSGHSPRRHLPLTLITTRKEF